MDGKITYTQMRKLQGGGTRQIEIEKSATVETAPWNFFSLLTNLQKDI